MSNERAVPRTHPTRAETIIICILTTLEDVDNVRNSQCIKSFNLKIENVSLIMTATVVDTCGDGDTMIAVMR